MDNLILSKNNGNVVISGRVLHEYLEIKTPYNQWFKRMIEACELEENVDYTPHKFVHPQNKQDCGDHAIKLETAKEICMIQRGEKATAARKYFKQCLKQYDDALRARAHAENACWLDTRTQGKVIRRGETDAIQELIGYATEQGSKNARMYTNLVHKAVGINKGERMICDRRVLTCIMALEDMISNTIFKIYYKEIYPECKKRVDSIMQYYYLPEQRLLTVVDEGIELDG